jgi:hypothetical protein
MKIVRVTSSELLNLISRVEFIQLVQTGSIARYTVLQFMCLMS